MIRETASEYLRSVHDLAMQVQASDAAGGVVPFDAAMADTVELITSLRDDGRKVLLIGNGGSAAVVAHMHVDLCNAGRTRALLFNDIPMLTATSNDHGYGAVFERPGTLWADEGDVLIAVSSSGRSENILRAVTACAERGCRAVTFTGFAPDNPLRRLGCLNFWVPAHAYGAVELVHSTLAHFITDLVARTAAAATDRSNAAAVMGELV